MWKKHCLRMESLPHEVVEEILERLPVKSLLRFKGVSKQWKATMESRFFREKQLKHREQSGDPDVAMVCLDPDLHTLVLGSSSSVKVPTPWERENTAYSVSPSVCDGLLCLPDPWNSAFVFNPTTRWYRSLPLSNLQLLEVKLGYDYYKLKHTSTNLGFGKDIITGTYKPVSLYDSAEIGLENATTCEVFDFSTNAWRYVTPSAPYRVVGLTGPVYVDGSLHWFTSCQETKVVSFDLHTEAFQVIANVPFADAPVNEIDMCNLDNRLCVSLKKCSNQVIWSFNSGNNTWDKLCSIDLDATSLWFDIPPLVCAISPLALFGGEDKKKKKNKLLFYDRISHRTLMTYNLETKTFDTAFSAESIRYPVCFFPSLLSVL